LPERHISIEPNASAAAHYATHWAAHWANERTMHLPIKIKNVITTNEKSTIED